MIDLIKKLYEKILMLLNILSFPFLVYFLIMSIATAFLKDDKFIYNAVAVVIILIFNYFT